MGGKDGRKCVFVDQGLHGQLSAIVALCSGAGKRGLSLQGLVDHILGLWLAENPVSAFLEIDDDVQLAFQEAAQAIAARQGGV